MLAPERRSKIMELIQQKHTVTVSELSALFSVTDETIRRDLERMESAGTILRTHGGAMLPGSSIAKLEQPSNVRKKINIQAKEKIALLAKDLVQPGDGLMLDDSSTSLFIATALKKLERLTVITNSIEIVSEISDIDDWNIMSTGGLLKQRSMSFVGNPAETMISRYHVDKAFISCKGLSLQHGMTESSEPSALVKRCMVHAANEAILAVDSSKFGRLSFVQIERLENLYAIITDTKPSDEWLEALDVLHIRCIYPE